MTTSFSERTLDGWLKYIGMEHPKNVLGGLARVAEVGKRAGLNPPAPRNIVVAGTNGKGSTSVFLEQLLIAGGLTVGTTLSPHVHRFNERIRVNGRDCDDGEIVAAFEAVEAARGDIKLTYFEYAILAAMRVFATRKVDVTVLEVGLGGRLDAVNIVDADVTVITSIGIEHTDYLGDTCDLIGLEKAGIMRPDVPLVFGDPAMPTSIQGRVDELAAPLFLRGREFLDASTHDGWSVTVTRPDGMKDEILSTSHPRVARQNAATAVQAVTLFRGSCNDAMLRSACRHAAIPGRFERIEIADATFVLDVAHNPHGAQFFARQVTGLFAGRRIHAVVSMFADKDVRGVLAPFASLVEDWTFTDCARARGLSGDALRSRAPSVRARVVPDPREAIESLAQRTVPGASLGSTQATNDVILVFGSFDVVEHARETLRGT
ncbi:MAG: Mur ligase family protein [Gammaproteobacteria bacterium]|nr:Mur ligase family protein [Gammaproteobacteria bacterium]